MCLRSPYTTCNFDLPQSKSFKTSLQTWPCGSYRDKNLLYSRSPKAETFWDRRWLQGTLDSLWKAVILICSLMPRPEEIHLCWMLRTRTGNLLTWAIENIWYLLQYQGTIRILTYYHLSLVVFLPHSSEEYVKMTLTECLDHRINFPSY